MRAIFFAGIQLTAAMLLGLASCSAPKAKTPERTCGLEGEVVRLDSQVHTAVIKHQKICDWMEPMTMEFPVRDAKEFQILKAGAHISATVHIGDPEFWISDIKVQGQ